MNLFTGYLACACTPKVISLSRIRMKSALLFARYLMFSRSLFSLLDFCHIISATGLFIACNAIICSISVWNRSLVQADGGSACTLSFSELVISPNLQPSASRCISHISGRFWSCLCHGNASVLAHGVSQTLMRHLL